jgi:hypothetical protein
MTLLSDAGVEKSQRTLTLVGQKLTETQGDVAELRNKLAGLALLSTIDPDHQDELIDLRARLAASEASMRELSAAEKLAGDLAREAKTKALEATAKADWEAAGMALDEAVITAQSLDAMARQFGDLYRRLQTELARAGTLAATHMTRLEHKMLVQPPSLDLPLRLLWPSGGPGSRPARGGQFRCPKTRGYSNGF